MVRPLIRYMSGTRKLGEILNQGYRFVKDYGNYCLYEKVVHDKVLYRECFLKVELYGADWTRSVRREQ